MEDAVRRMGLRVLVSERCERASFELSTEAVDEHTVKVTLNHPSNLWLYDISSTAGIIYDPDGLAAVELERNAVHRPHHAVAGVEVGAQVLDIEQWHRTPPIRAAARAVNFRRPGEFSPLPDRRLSL